MYMNVDMSIVLGTSVRFVLPCPWVKVSLVEETTKCHQKVKHSETDGHHEDQGQLLDRTAGPALLRWRSLR